MIMWIGYEVRWEETDQYRFISWLLEYRSDIYFWIIIGSDRRPETKQGIEGKIVRFRLGRVRDRVRVRDKDR